jgi:hypothetical protein
MCSECTPDRERTGTDTNLQLQCDDHDDKHQQEAQKDDRYTDQVAEYVSLPHRVGWLQPASHWTNLQDALQPETHITFPVYC